MITDFGMSFSSVFNVEASTLEISQLDYEFSKFPRIVYGFQIGNRIQRTKWFQPQFAACDQQRILAHLHTLPYNLRQFGPENLDLAGCKGKINAN
jgi:hypothetical protein